MPTLLRRGTILAIAFSSLALAACDGQTPPESTRSTVGSLTVTSVDDLAWPSPNDFSISPDGKHLATYDSGELCISDFAGSKQVCAPHADAMRGRLVAVDYIRWSPDNTRIAFTEDSFVGNESDIWVMNISSGKLTNLTDDKLTQRRGTPTSKALIDLLPHWTKDGTQLGFVRDLGSVVEDIDKPSEVYILNAVGAIARPKK